MDTTKTGAAQRENILNALGVRPRLTRRESWIAPIESQPERPEIPASGLQRLGVLLDLPGNDSAERLARALMTNTIEASKSHPDRRVWLSSGR